MKFQSILFILWCGNLHIVSSASVDPTRTNGGQGGETCEDWVQSCAAFKHMRLCSNGWMSSHCQKTCGVCIGGQQAVPCEDWVQSCVAFKHMISCSNGWMSSHCQKTCGVCSGGSLIDDGPKSYNIELREKIPPKPMGRQHCTICGLSYCCS